MGDEEQDARGSSSGWVGWLLKAGYTSSDLLLVPYIEHRHLAASNQETSPV